MAKFSAALNEDPGTGLLVQEALEAFRESLFVASINFANELTYFTGLGEAASACTKLRELMFVRIEKKTMRIIQDFFREPRMGLVKLRISDVPRDTIPILEHIAEMTGNLEHFEYTGTMIRHDTAAAMKVLVHSNSKMRIFCVVLTGPERTNDEDRAFHRVTRSTATALGAGTGGRTKRSTARVSDTCPLHLARRRTYRLRTRAA